MFRGARLAAGARAPVEGDEGDASPVPRARKRDIFATAALAVWCAVVMILIYQSSSRAPVGVSVAVPPDTSSGLVAESASATRLPEGAIRVVGGGALVLPNTLNSRSRTSAATHTPTSAVTPSNVVTASPSAAGTPAGTPAPNEARLLTFDDHPKKYLMLIQGQEGFGACSMSQLPQPRNLPLRASKSYSAPPGATSRI